MRSDHLQDQVMALQLKLKEEEIMRKKSVEEYGKMAGELVKLQNRQEELQAEKKELQTEKNQLALKNEELNDKLMSVQESIVSNHITPHYVVLSSLDGVYLCVDDKEGVSDVWYIFGEEEV